VKETNLRRRIVVSPVELVGEAVEVVGPPVPGTRAVLAGEVALGAAFGQLLVLLLGDLLEESAHRWFSFLGGWFLEVRRGRG